MALAIFDFARVLTTSIAVESAAREAADFGGLYPWHWNSDDPDWDSGLSAIPTVVENMTTRACTAVSTLTDYEGDDPALVAPGDPVTCTNPTVTWAIDNDTAHPNCYDVPRTEAPCRVTVTVTYDFNVIVPLRLNFGDTELGLPSSVTLVRDSTFAVSNFELDETLAP